MPVARIAAPVLLGMVVAGLVVAMVEGAGSFIHPLPDDLKGLRGDELTARTGDLKAHAEAAPFAAKAVVVLAWTLGAFAGCWIAGRVAGPRRHWFGLIVALLVVPACLAMLLMIPSPAWMWLAGLLLPIAAAVTGARLARWPDQFEELPGDAAAPTVDPA